MMSIYYPCQSGKLYTIKTYLSAAYCYQNRKKQSKMRSMNNANNLPTVGWFANSAVDSGAALGLVEDLTLGTFLREVLFGDRSAFGIPLVLRGRLVAIFRSSLYI